MKTSEIFVKEIGYIKNELLRKIVSDVLDSSPVCIQVIPASSSGKYHSASDIVVGAFHEDGTVTTGGLVNHIKAVASLCRDLVATDIFKNIILNYPDNSFDADYLQDCADCAIAACILHDCMKPDDTPKHNTNFNHPVLAAELFKNKVRNYITEENVEYLKVITPLVYRGISRHMGQWNTASYARGVVLPKPDDGFSEFVHLCDYIASRRYIDFDWNKYEAR